MPTIISEVREVGVVPFPTNRDDRVYMLPFTQREGLPERLYHWQPTVDAMLRNVDAPAKIYLMVDYGFVTAGSTLRRPGAHIDGVWIERLRAHGSHSTNGNLPPNGGSHGFPRQSHVTTPARKQPDSQDLFGTGRHGHIFHLGDEALILASDVTGCVAYVGEVEGEPAEGGDCSHFDLSSLKRLALEGGKAFSGNSSMLHESIPMVADCYRTVVRLNVQGVRI